jgi:hypothetical protein
VLPGRPSAPKLVASAYALAVAACSEAPNSSPGDAAIDADPLNPFVIRYVPNGGDSNVAPDVMVSATFNKPVLGVGTFTFKLTRRDTDAWRAAYVAYDAETRTVSLVPQAPLDTDKTYVVTLSPEIVDTEGRPLVGTTSWMFAIAPDTTPPAVTLTSPTTGATNVAVDTTIVATLSEAIAGVTAASFFLEGPNGPIAASVALLSKTTVSLTPTVQLAPQTVYQASLTSTIVDIAGNPLMGAPIAWTFKTGADTIAPVLSSRFPEVADSDILLSTNVTARFSEPVINVSTASMTLDKAGSVIPATVTYSPTTRLARLTPTAALSANTTYTVTLTSAITDVFGNALAAPVTWSFETGSAL